MYNKAPVYNLNVVLRETGLKADVLRVWERRYDLPKPSRSQGGHRLYSDYDIAVVKWLRARQIEGMSISRAVELWKDLEERGRDPLEELALPEASGYEPRAQADSRIEIIRGQWLDACMEFDGPKAEEILNQAFALFPLETVCTEVLQKGVSVMGDLWFSGKASVQQEHFTSALAVRRLEALIHAASSPTREQSILLACPSGEGHVFSVLLLNLLLRRKGWKVIYLGSDVPIEEMNETLAVIRPDIIVLAAQQIVSAAALSSWVEQLRGHDLPVAYGGLVFNRIAVLRERIAAWFLGEQIEQAVARIEQLVLRQEKYPYTTSIREDAREAARSFREKRPLVEMHLLKDLRPSAFPEQNIGEINAYFGSGMTAALDLGDPAYLEPDLKWISGLLERRHIPVNQLKTYLQLYAQAIYTVMGKDGDMIIGWLDDYIERQ